MKKKLHIAYSHKEHALIHNTFLWIMVLLPVLYSAVESPEFKAQNPAQLPENSAVIYMTPGTVMVGLDELPETKIIHFIQDDKKAATKPKLPNGKAIATKISKKQIVKVETPVSTNIPVTTGQFIFSSLPISGCAFSADAKIHAIGLIPTTNSQKFSAATISTLQSFSKNYFENKKHIYNYSSSVTLLDSRSFSLRAPPPFLI